MTPIPQLVPEEWSREIRDWLLGGLGSIDRLPRPSGRESVFELLCVVRLPGFACHFQGWLGGERLPRRFDALVTFDKPRAGFHGILLEARSGAQSFADTVHRLKACRSALRDSLPGPLLVWGVVEGGVSSSRRAATSRQTDSAMTTSAGAGARNTFRGSRS